MNKKIEVKIEIGLDEKQTEMFLKTLELFIKQNQNKATGQFGRKKKMRSGGAQADHINQ